MDIAILAPSPIPFVLGGAENFWFGLQRFINEETHHHCEVFKTPSPETSFEDVVRSYRRFSELKYDHFDRVISSKYPAWMVSHKKHVVYLFHTLRGLYDTYHFSNQPIRATTESEVVRDLRCAMNAVRERAANLEFFFDEIERRWSENETELLRLFPGPISREIVHFLDQQGMAPDRITAYHAISRTVSARENYFPRGASVGVLYPPSKLSGYWCADGEFLFTTSRLDGPKRVGLLIEAMRHVKSSIRLLIGGKGPDEERLKALAGDDKRIEFVGYLNESELLDYYAHALAVPFVPYDEDYGLITIEAMMSGKPVITTTDSGGVSEFVINHETGLAVPPDPLALARAIDYMCEHRDEAREMGERARRRVSGITWRNVAETLIGEPLKNPRRAVTRPVGTSPTARERLPQADRKKMVVALTFPVYPPRGGGQSRVFNLYREWARLYDVVLVTLTGPSEASFEEEIAPGLIEIRTPKTSAHQAEEDSYSATVGWIPVTDIVASTLIHHTPDFIRHLKRECEEAEVVVASHPYFVKALRSVAPSAELWFEAHNVELSLKQSILPATEAASALLEMVRSDEGEAWREASVVFACAEQDLRDLANIYGPNSARQFEVPNGYADDDVVFTTPALRRTVKAQLGLADRHTVVFMGSWHGPNLEAAKRVVEYAAALPAITFLVIGSAGLAFANSAVPDNVHFLGVLDDHEKQVVLSAADLAINPMVSGSGSNLKMFDYFAAGVPVLTTTFGARGMGLIPASLFFVAEIDDFVSELTDIFVLTGSASMEKMASSVVESLKQNYSWSAIAAAAMRDFFDAPL